MKPVIIIAIAFVFSSLIFSVGVTQAFGYGGGGGGGGKEPDARVCGDRLCSEIPGGRATWEEKGMVPSMTKNESFVTSLKNQIRNGMSLDSLMCNDGLELMLKSSSGNPACIKASSVLKLIERGWAIHILPDYEKNNNNNSVIFSLGEFQVDSIDVSYYQNSTGYLAKPQTDGNYPGVIMIHEWWGLNENIKEMAQKLASHGYVVFAVDLYDGEVAVTSEQARQLMGSFDKEQGIQNMNQASLYIQKHHSPEKIGSIGWCFGGGQSLNLALNNNEMDATVIYYGQLETEKQILSRINWPILGIFAELDQGIPPDVVNEFEKSLNELEIPNEIYIYPDVNHAFANPSGDRYAPDESMDAWLKTIQFLEINLK